MFEETGEVQRKFERFQEGDSVVARLGEGWGWDKEDRGIFIKAGPLDKGIDVDRVQPFDDDG